MKSLKFRPISRQVKTKESKKGFPRWWLILAATFFVVLLLGVGVVWSYQKIYASKIFPGVKVSSLNLGGLSYEEAFNSLETHLDKIMSKDLLFVWQNKEVAVSPIIISPTDPDYSYRILSFEGKKMVEQSYLVGRTGSFLTNILDQARALFVGHKISVVYTLDEKELKNILVENFAIYESPAQEAQLIFNKGEFSVQEEKLGRIFAYDKALGEIKDYLNELKIASAAMYLKTDYPKIYRAEVEIVLPSAREAVEIAPLELNFAEDSWQVSQAELASWFESRAGEEGVSLGLNQERVAEYLRGLVPEINIEPKDGKFKITNGKVSEFQSSEDGRVLSLDKNFTLLEKAIFESKITELDLIVEVIKPKTSIAEINDLGIKELIGVGTSDFSWSPTNRRHNIATGSKSLHGILIEPEQIFSLGEALGEITAETGYLPEMVIKGNKTIPEYGGGLCQIATTAFRVALNTGLPIIERHHHSYRVSYYEPAGLDAAIYTPYVDVKFKNDTGNYILFQTEIEGDILTFKFYGTKDDRQVEITEPKIYNFVKPPEKKIVETTDLPVGETKCTERAHTGADTEFDYTVRYSDGEVKEETFYSHYQPWQEVCLIGVEEE